ncbi:hypothetical protein H8356DRAFT_1428377 [Neocallimastix lanati (nom. inval.)]|nr:hypothetical protein H8356DRAFT_1428377 [Neocallimastix sp. JGI-2020a]
MDLFGIFNVYTSEYSYKRYDIATRLDGWTYVILEDINGIIINKDKFEYYTISTKTPNSSLSIFLKKNRLKDLASYIYDSLKIGILNFEIEGSVYLLNISNQNNGVFINQTKTSILIIKNLCFDQHLLIKRKFMQQNFKNLILEGHFIIDDIFCECREDDTINSYITTFFKEISTKEFQYRKEIKVYIFYNNVTTNHYHNNNYYYYTTLTTTTTTTYYYINYHNTYYHYYINYHNNYYYKN